MSSSAAMDVDSTDFSGPSSTKISPPLFNFPTEKSRTFTSKDLIAILRLNNARSTKDHETAKLAIPIPAEASSQEALDIIHKMDPTRENSTRKRVIFRQWPRDPKGENITPENTLVGKMAPNGIRLWGASMFDFYRVRRMPDVEGLSTISTGSKLMNWMKAHNELEYAKDEIEWAEMEDKPRLIEAWSPRHNIEEMEEKIKQGQAGKSMPMTDLEGEKISPDLSSPWPLVPFSYETERLTSRIDLDHLPKKLIVHDPWNVLAVDTDTAFGDVEPFEGEEWTSKKDRIHVYHLNLSGYGTERAKREAEARAKLEERDNIVNKNLSFRYDQPEFVNERLEGYIISPPQVPGPIEPPIFVVHGPPPKPHSRTSKKSNPIEEAHLYLSPAQTIGRGNHSVVYNAEWVLPRSAVIPPPSTDFILCDQCVNADVARIIREQDGEHGEHANPIWKVKSGEVRVFHEGHAPVVFHIVSPDQTKEQAFRTEDKRKCRMEYKGPVRPIRTTVQWQDPDNPTCEHIKSTPKVPPTVTMRVVGKLSLPGDDHLLREANNYEAFKQHMFEHWSGLNVVLPMHDPVPVGALVAQYYGYYVPEQDLDTDSEETTEENRPSDDMDTSTDTPSEPKHLGYLSPILLLEDCGRPVNPSRLNHDQRNEVLSLMYRFHHAGWSHGSVYARNILSQPGPISAAPSNRSEDTPSFRLIDFGRSYRCKDDNGAASNVNQFRSDRYSEEVSMEKLFGMYMY